MYGGEMNDKGATETNRIIWLDVLKIWALFSMMLLHTASWRVEGATICSFDWDVWNIYDSITRWCVPIFLMISGALFLSPKKDVTIKNIWKRYILKIVVNFAMWSFLYVLLDIAFVWHTQRYIMKLGDILYELFTGHFHMWYLIVIVILYTITPLLREVCDNRELMKYMVVIFCVLGFSWNILWGIDSTTFSRVVSYYDELLRLDKIMGFSCYYILGSYIERYGISVKRKSIYILGIASLIFNILMTYFMSRSSNSVCYQMNDYLSITVFFVSVGVFIFFKDVFSKKSISHKIVRLVNIIASASLEIYLFHAVILVLYSLADRKLNVLNPIFEIPILTIVMFIISCTVGCMISIISGKFMKLYKTKE